MCSEHISIYVKRTWKTLNKTSAFIWHSICYSWAEHFLALFGYNKCILFDNLRRLFSFYEVDFSYLISVNTEITYKHSLYFQMTKTSFSTSISWNCVPLATPESTNTQIWETKWVTGDLLFVVDDSIPLRSSIYLNLLRKFLLNIATIWETISANRQQWFFIFSVIADKK